MFGKDSVLRLFISVFVAMLLTMFAIVVTSEYTPAVLYIIGGMAAGAFLWLLGEILFPWFEKLFPKSVLPGYIVIILLILIGTTGFSYMLGLKNIPVLIIIGIVAEINGVGIVVLYRRKYMRELNKNLEQNKNKLD